MNDANAGHHDTGIEILSSEFDWVAELIVELKDSSNELARVCESLGNRPDTTILTVVPTRMGARISCGGVDPDSFLGSLSDVPSVASWRFTPK